MISFVVKRKEGKLRFDNTCISILKTLACSLANIVSHAFEKMFNWFSLRNVTI